MSTFWAIDTPGAPTVSVIGTTRDSCQVSWSAVTPPANSLITGYVILIDDGHGGSYSVAYNGRNNPSVLSYSIQNFQSQTNYNIIGFAVNKAGDGANSTAITCYTATIPGQPGTPQLVSSSPTNIQV